jgi:hypothetical protein
MLKKVTYIFISILLLTTTMGFSVSRHYCNNKIVEIKIDKVADTCCDDDTCCSTETIVVQLQEDATSAANVIIPAQVELSTFISAFIVLFNIHQPESEIVSFNVTDSSPPLSIHTVLSIIQSYLL